MIARLAIFWGFAVCALLGAAFVATLAVYAIVGIEKLAGFI